MAQNITKRTLIMSVISMLLCMTMLVGSTFAWFTDTATTGVNTIQSGNLDVGLNYSKDFNTWNNAEGADDIFNPNAEWEPGYTEVVYFEVVNNGDLAFNYRVGTNLIQNQTGLNKNGDIIDLTDYIKFGIIPVSSKFESRTEAKAAVTSPIDFANAFFSENSLDTKGSSQKFAMVVFMPDDVDNSANHDGINIPSITFGIQVIASQKASEQDSFGPDYDGKATYPDFAFTDYSSEQSMVFEGEIFRATASVNADLKTESNAEIPEGTDIIMSIVKADAVNSNIVLDAGETSETYEISLMTEHGEKVLATGEPLNVEMYIGTGRTGEISLYHNETQIPITGYNATTGVLTFTSCDFSPYTVIETLFISDTQWYSDEASEFIIATPEQLFGFADLVNQGNYFTGKTVKLGADIDLKNAEWTPIALYDNTWFNGIFDGQHYSISNLTSSGTYYEGLFGKLYNATVKDLSLDTVDISCSSYSGALAGYANGINTFDNVDVENITVEASSGVYVGGMVGYIYNTAKEQNTFTNCDITADEGRTNSITAPGYYVGGMIGACNGTTLSITDCSFDSISIDGTLGYAGGVIGYAYNKSVLEIKDCTTTDLVITAPGQYGFVAGVAGYISQTPSTFENITVTNIKLDVAANAAAGIVSRIEGNNKTTITSCHVGGEIQIKSAGYTAGIASRVEYYGNAISNCSVIGGEGTNSYIDGGNAGGYIGGIFGWMPEGKFGISDCQVKNIAINAGQKVGAIGGMVHYGHTHTNLVSENVSITAHGTALSRGLLFGENNATKASVVKIFNYSIINTTVNGEVIPVASSIKYGPADTQGGTFAASTVTLDDSGKVIGGIFDIIDADSASKVLAEGYRFTANADGTYTVTATAN